MLTNPTNERLLDICHAISCLENRMRQIHGTFRLYFLLVGILLGLILASLLTGCTPAQGESVAEFLASTGQVKIVDTKETQKEDDEGILLTCLCYPWTRDSGRLHCQCVSERSTAQLETELVYEED